MSDYNQKHNGCPFDYRLARTPYLVLPKLAIQSMPMPWRRRFEAMLQEMDDTGLETPNYVVLRNDGERQRYTRARVVNEQTGFVRIVKGEDDPWANYRHGSAEELCNYKRPIVHAPEPVERRPSPSHIWVPSWDGENGYWKDAIGLTVTSTYKYGAKEGETRGGVVKEHSRAHDTFGIAEYEGDPTLLWLARDQIVVVE